MSDNEQAAAFADKNLKLALLDEIQPAYGWVATLRHDYELVRETKHPEWPSWETFEDADECEHRPALEAFLLARDVPVAALASITSLTLDGDRDLYSWVFPYWWEAGDHFTIRDLSGLEHCSALTYLHLGQGLTHSCSLRPLEGLSQLSELWVCGTGCHRDIEALLELPNLVTLELANWKNSSDAGAWQRVIDAVARRRAERNQPPAN